MTAHVFPEILLRVWHEVVARLADDLLHVPSSQPLGAGHVDRAEHCATDNMLVSARTSRSGAWGTLTSQAVAGELLELGDRELLRGRHGVHRERTQRDRLVKEKNEHEIEITAVEIRDMGYETGREITHLYKKGMGGSYVRSS